MSVSVVRECEMRGVDKREYERKGAESGKDCDWNAWVVFIL